MVRNCSFEKIPAPTQEIYMQPKITKQNGVQDEEIKTQQVKSKAKKTPIFNKSNNRKLIKNAITNVCLAGEPNKGKREEVLKILTNIPPDKNVLVLFKDIIGGRQVFANQK
jgi:hypothetical protein